jgi:FkbM family methyltransferase
MFRPRRHGAVEMDGLMAIWKPVKNLIRQSCRTLGYEIIPLRDVKDRDFSIHLSQLFALLQVDCVFDVGANVGQYRDFLRNKVHYTGTIVSFEPIASDVSILRKRAAQDGNWLIEGCALGAERGRMPINVAKSDQFSSFLTPDNGRVPAFAGLNDTSHSEIVEIFPLDDIFAALQQRIGFRQPYLKLDTQGYDTEVLRGAKAVLPAICALQTEASVIAIYRNMPDYKKTIGLLNECGFELTGLYPVSRDECLRVIELDCVMLNRQAARDLLRMSA